MNSLFKGLLFLSIAGLPATTLQAATDYLWNNAAWGYVDNTANWSPAGVPGNSAGDRAIVNNGLMALVDAAHFFGPNRIGSGLTAGDYALEIGGAAGNAGSLQQSGGTVDSNWGLRVGYGNYGYYGISGGVLKVRSPQGVNSNWAALIPNNMAILVGSDEGPGVFNQTGGVVNQINSSGAGWIQTVIGGSGAADNLMNINGGFFGPTNEGGNTDYAFCLGWIGHSGRNVLNIGGAGVMDVTQTGVAGGRVVLGYGGAATELNILNLGDVKASLGGSGGVNGGGGTLVAANILGGPVKNPGGGIGIVNFHGGTLQAAAAASPHGTLLYANNAYIYSEGAVIDTQNGTTGTNQIIDQNLEAPGGNGVTGIELGANHGSGYIGEPIVTLTDSGGTGTGATARAIVDLDPTHTATFGTITGLVVTNPGVNYSGTVTANFTGGGLAAVAPDVGTIATSLNVSGGLTKTGLGNLILNAGCTYAGPTTVAGGTLALNGVTLSSNAIVVKSAGTLAGYSSTDITTIAYPQTTVEANGTITPGTPGQYLYLDKLSLENNSNLNFTIDGLGNYNQIMVNNDIAKVGAAPITVNVSATGSRLGSTTLLSVINGGILDDAITFTLPGGKPVLDSDDGVHSEVTLFTQPGVNGHVDLISGGELAAIVPAWNAIGGGNWTENAKWGNTPPPPENKYPNGNDKRAMFTNSLGNSAIPISLNISPTLSSMIFASPNGESYNITPSGGTSITLNSGLAQNWHITVLGGTHVVAADLKLGAGTGPTAGQSAIRLVDGSHLTLSGVLSDETTAAGVHFEGNFNAGTGTGVLTLSEANIYTGPTTVSGGVLEVPTITNINLPNSLGKSGVDPANLALINATLRYTGTAAATTNRGMTISGVSTIQLGGDTTFSSSQIVGTACQSLTINGPGKMTLDSGTITMPDAAGLGELWLGDNAAGVLNVNGTTAVTARGLLVGKTGGSEAGKGGAINQSGGTVTVFGDGGDPGSSFAGVVIGHSAYGSYKITGGELNLNTGNSIWPFLFVGLFAPGVYDQSGGTVISPRAENTMLGYMGDAPAVMNITGGLYQESHISVGNGIVVGCGSSFTGRATGGTATLNIGGGPALATVDITTGAVSGFVALGLGDTGTGIVNLGTNGVLKSGSVIGGGVIGQKGTGIFNFHGGTLNLGAASLPSGATTAMEGLDHAYIYSEGAIIDTNGMDATIAQNLESPGGSGIKKIDVGSGSGYLGAPVVTISGGTGSGATAVAVMNGDKIDHIAITNPGTGYDSADVLTVTLSGGGYSAPATASIGTGSNYFAANVGGGLKKIGGGALTLTGALTYAGNTTVNEGTLNVTALSTPSATVTVKDGAILNAVSITADTLTIGGVPETAAVAVPEPGTLALLAIAILGGIGMAWRKRK